VCACVCVIMTCVSLVEERWYRTDRRHTALHLRHDDTATSSCGAFHVRTPSRHRAGQIKKPAAAAAAAAE